MDPRPIDVLLWLEETLEHRGKDERLQEVWNSMLQLEQQLEAEEAREFASGHHAHGSKSDENPPGVVP